MIAPRQAIVTMVGLTASLFLLAHAAPAPAQSLDGTLKKVKDSGALTLGYRESSPPFSFVGADKRPIGYSIDLECGSTTNSLSRQEQVDFSHMIFVDGSSLLIKADKVAAMQDLSGKKIAVIPGTTTDPAVRAALQKAFVTAQIVPVKDHREGLTMLENGSVDAYASDRTILIGLGVTAKDPSQFAIAEQYFSYEPYGFMLKRGDAPFRLAVNRVLSSLYRSREVMQVYGRWFGKLGEPSGLLLAMYALHALPE